MNESLAEKGKPLIQRALLQERGNGRLDPEIRSIIAALTAKQIPFDLFVEKQLCQRKLPLSLSTLVAGHIPVVIAALKQLGIDAPTSNDYPRSLQPWLGRKMWTSTVGAVVTMLQQEMGGPIFVKPMGTLKRFGGHVMRGWDDLRHLAHAADHLPVICSEVVTWLSEFRVYVIAGKVVGIRHYLGDPKVEIDRRVIEEAVNAFEASGEVMAGYAADFGVLEGGKTVLVEVNEGYGLGSYGLDDEAYTRLIIARWCELTSRPGREVTT